jgi:hypothetical protein
VLCLIYGWQGFINHPPGPSACNTPCSATFLPCSAEDGQLR